MNRCLQGHEIPRKFRDARTLTVRLINCCLSKLTCDLDEACEIPGYCAHGKQKIECLSTHRSVGKMCVFAYQAAVCLHNPLCESNL